MVRPVRERVGRAADEGGQQHQHERDGQLGLACHLLAAHFGVAGHVGHDDGHVVVASGGYGGVHQLRSAPLRIARERHEGLDVLVLHLSLIHIYSTVVPSATDSPTAGL